MILLSYELVMPARLRLDKGTETVDMATMHSYLLSQHFGIEDSENCVIYMAPRQKIELRGGGKNFWRGLNGSLKIS